MSAATLVRLVPSGEDGDAWSRRQDIEDESVTSGRDIGGAFRRLLRIPLAAAATLGALVVGFSLLSDSPNFHGHAAGHWTMAIPVLFVALVIVRLPEARTTPRRIARLLLAIVVFSLAFSLLLEGIGAFASSGKGPLDTALESMHDLGSAGTLFSIFALPLSFVTLAVVYALVATRALIRRLSSAKGV